MATYYLTLTGSDNNSGTSLVVRSTGTDGATNAGNNTLTSASASWSAADIGHAIKIGSTFRRITAVGSGTSLTYDGASCGTLSSQTWTIGGAIRTFSQLTASQFVGGIQSGETAYIGPGTYRELLQLNMTSPTAETLFIGDVDGSHTGGTAGEVVLSAFLTGDYAAPSSSDLLNLNGKDFCTFQNLRFVQGTGKAILASTSTSTDIKFQDCSFEAAQSNSNTTLVYTSAADTAANWLIERCQFVNQSTNGVLQLTTTTSTVADYNLNFIVRNCEFNIPTGALLALTASGANTFKAGGVILQNCTAQGVGGNVVSIGSAAACSLVYPCVFTNNLVGGTASSILSGNTNGTIVEDYNRTISGLTFRSNVLAGTASISSTPFAPMLQLGHEVAVGQLPRPYYGPTRISPHLGFGNIEIAVGVPATFASDSGVVGTAWTNPGNAAYSDDTRAVATAVPATTGVTEFLKCTNIAWMNAPGSDATILGVRVETEFSASAGSAISCNKIQLVKGGVIGGNDYAAYHQTNTVNTQWTTSDQLTYTGSHTDLWGNTLAYSDVTASTFGVAISAKNTSAGTVDARIDFVRLIVYYVRSSPTVSVDILNRPRPAGGNLRVAAGTATAGAVTTLTDSGATWGTDTNIGGVLYLTGGTGSGQSKMIKSHTGTVITVFGNWATTPDNTSTYVIFFGAPSDTGKATSGAATTITQSTQSWGTNMWAGYVVELTGGTGSGQKRYVISNTATALTVGPGWTTNPDSTTTFSLYRRQTITDVLPAVGAYERHDNAVNGAVLSADAGGWLEQFGWDDHEFRIPVDASSTTISVKVKWDASAGNTNKPQAVLLANPQIGVTTETKTATGTAGSAYETLTFSAQTPSAKGWVTVSLRARSDKPYGTTAWDSFAIA